MFTRRPTRLEAHVYLASGVILASITLGMPDGHRPAHGAHDPLSAHPRILAAFRRTAPLAGAPGAEFNILHPLAISSVHSPAANALADPIIELAELQASDGGFSDFLGFAVAISGDTIVVGSPEHQVGGKAQQGAVYIFVKPAKGWATTSTFTAELTASDGLAMDNFGEAVSISGDTIIVGSCSLTGVCANGPGKVYVFEKPANGWAATSSASAELTASDGAATDSFGIPADIAGDTVVVGTQPAPGAAISGKAYVFVKPAGGWSSTTETAELTASDEQPGDVFGEVAVSGDGNTIFVGSPLASVNSGSQQGAGYVFAKPAKGWATTNQFAAKLTAGDEETSDQFGFCQNSGCISNDGSTIVLGAPQLDVFSSNATGPGKAYVYVKPADGWTTTSIADAELTASDGNLGDAFGFSEAVSSDGDEVAIGSVVASPMVHGQGAIYVYNRPSSGWARTASFDAKLLANNAGQGDNLGFAVSLDQGTIVGGAIAVSEPVGGQGAAYVFGAGEPFSISAGSGVNVSSPGQSGSTAVTVSPNGGFTGTVTLSCTPDTGANETSCGFTSGSTSGATIDVNLSGSSVDVTFNVTTTAPHMLAALRTAPAGTAVGLAASALLVFLIPVAFRRRRALLSFAALAFLLTLGACGGGGGGGRGGHTDPGTASGNYTFNVTGTSGSGLSAASVTTSVLVTVQ